MWQDYVIGAMTIMFGIALVPQVIQGFVQRKGVILISTGLPTFLGLYVLALTFATLELYFSMVMNLVTGTLWLLLLVQTIFYGRSRKT